MLLVTTDSFADTHIYSTVSEPNSQLGVGGDLSTLQRQTQLRYDKGCVHARLFDFIKMVNIRNLGNFKITK